MTTTAIESAVTELEAAIAATEATPAPAPRPSVSNDELRGMPTGAILRVRTDADTPETDFFVYAEDRQYNDALDSRMVTLVNYYLLTPSLGLGDYRYGHNGLRPEQIVAIEDRDYYNWKATARWVHSVGMFNRARTRYLPDSLVSPEGAKPGDFTWLEVLSKTGVGAETEFLVRVFSPRSATPDYVEYGHVTGKQSDLAQWANDSMYDPALFAKSYGLVKDVTEVGKLYFSEGELYTVTELRGHIARMVPASEDTGEAIPGGHVVEFTRDRLDGGYITEAADNAAAYVASLPDEATRAALMQLSRTTVTQALKHADSNDYCSETAVALVSAGHVMPELRVKGRIIIDMDVTTKEYMILRRLAGASNSDLSNISEVLVKNWTRFSEKLPGAPRNLPEGAQVELEATMDWKAPKLRKMS